MHPRKIAFIVLGGIGDILMTSPSFRAIKEKYPDVELDVFVRGHSQSVIASYSDNITHIVNLSSNGGNIYTETVIFIKFLIQKKYDIIIHNHIVDGKKFYFLPFLFGIKTRLGFRRDKISLIKGYKYFSRFLTNNDEYLFNKIRRVEMNLGLLRYLDINNENIFYDFKVKMNSNCIPKTVLIHPGSDKGGYIKRWSIEKFIELSQLIEGKIGLKVLFNIGPDEEEYLDYIEDKFEILKILPLPDLIKEMTKISYFIGNEGGLAHLASAMDIPSLVIFGPTTKAEFLLPTKTIVSETHLDCRPCFYLKQECPINKKCLVNLSVEKVFSDFKRLLTRNTAINQ